MASIKRHDTAIMPTLTINQSGGSAYDLTDHTAKFIMIYPTTLEVAIDSAAASTGIALPNTAKDIVEVNDIIVIEHERLKVSAVPVLPDATDTVHYTVSRGHTTADTAAVIYGSTAVAGDGDNIFRLDVACVFSLAVGDTSAVVITQTVNATTENSTIAHLVTDVQAVVDSFMGASNITVTNVANKLEFRSDAVGKDAYIAISSPDAQALDQLGLVATTDYGEDSVTTTVVGHPVSSTVRVLKVEEDAILYDATAGKVRYEWREGDTNKLGAFTMEFEIKDTAGRYFTAPNDGTFSVTIVSDFNDRNIKDGE